MRGELAAMRSTELGHRAQARAWVFAVLVCAVGIVGLVHDSWPKSVQAPWINLHAVFGLMLWIMVVAQFRQAYSGRLVHGADYHSICRQSSRAVYFLLYILFGANQIIRFAVFLWNQGTIGAMHPAIVQPPENLRDYLAYGILALLTIRALTVLHGQSSKRGGLPSAFPDYQHHK
jgi:cytochrome b561